MSNDKVDGRESLVSRLEKCLRRFEPVQAKKLLREAAVTISEQDSVEPLFEIATICQVSDGELVEWVGELVDGDAFFIRYTRGKLTAFVDDSIVEYIEVPEAPVPGIELRQVRSLLAHTFRFPAAASSSNKPLEARPVGALKMLRPSQ